MPQLRIFKWGGRLSWVIEFSPGSSQESLQRKQGGRKVIERDVTKQADHSDGTVGLVGGPRPRNTGSP